MKAQSKQPHNIVKPGLYLIKKKLTESSSKPISSFLGKKIKAPITQERKNKFKSPDKLNKSNLSDKIFSKDKKPISSKSNSHKSLKSLNNSLSLNSISNSNKSIFNKKKFRKPALNLNKINITDTKLNKNSNLNIEKTALSNLQNIKPINRNISSRKSLIKNANKKANPQHSKKPTFSAEQKTAADKKVQQKALTPVKHKNAANFSSSALKSKQCSHQRQQSKSAKSVKSQNRNSTIKKKNNRSSRASEAKSAFSAEGREAHEVERNINFFDSAAADKYVFNNENDIYAKELSDDDMKAAKYSSANSNTKKQSKAAASVSYLESAAVSRSFSYHPDNYDIDDDHDDEYGTSSAAGNKYVFDSSAKKSSNNKSKTLQENHQQWLHQHEKDFGTESAKRNMNTRSVAHSQKRSKNSSSDGVGGKKFKSKNINDNNKDIFRSAEATKKSSADLNEDFFSGKKSKTKSFISILSSNQKTLSKSDKKSIKSIKDSVKKINFDDDAMQQDENETKSLTITSQKKKRKIE